MSVGTLPNNIISTNMLITTPNYASIMHSIFIPTSYRQTYPASARNLNRLTMTVDVDVYDQNSEKVNTNYCIHHT